MSFRKVYHAISSTDVKSFNKELKQYVDEGYEPFGSISVSSISDECSVTNTYTILLMKHITDD